MSTAETGTPDRTFNILVLCTGNSARSIMAEALLNWLAAPHVRAFSAGSRPVGAVNPHALARLAGSGLPVAGLRSKSWLEFATADGVPIDLVITVCANAAQESCPLWPGRPAIVHWGLADPAAADGSARDIGDAFSTAFDTLQRWIGDWLAEATDSTDRQRLIVAARAIEARVGAAVGATAPLRQEVLP